MGFPLKSCSPRFKPTELKCYQRKQKSSQRNNKKNLLQWRITMTSTQNQHQLLRHQSNQVLMQDIPLLDHQEVPTMTSGKQKPKQARRIELTPRDIEVFQDCLSGRYFTIHQLLA